MTGNMRTSLQTKTSNLAGRYVNVVRARDVVMLRGSSKSRNHRVGFPAFLRQTSAHYSLTGLSESETRLRVCPDLRYQLARPTPPALSLQPTSLEVRRMARVAPCSLLLSHCRTPHFFPGERPPRFAGDFFGQRNWLSIRVQLAYSLFDLRIVLITPSTGQARRSPRMMIAFPGTRASTTKLIPTPMRRTLTCHA